MASSFESLPLEVFEAIIHETDLVDLWHLQQCNSAFEITLDPYMMAEPHAIHKLMAWGCSRGNTWAIKKALSLGADISTVEVAWRNDTALLASALGLAASRFRYDIFEFLLKSGAQPDVPIHITQSAAFKRRLFAPQFPRFVELCQEYGVKDRIPDIQANLDATLVEAVKLNLKLNICQRWMDLGANPTARVGKSWNPETALSLAILSGSITLAKVMVSRGCYLDLAVLSPVPNDMDPWQHRLEPWKFRPMVAAAKRLASKGKTDMIDLLLKAGADLNVKCRVWIPLRPDCDDRTLLVVTPLLIYILSVDFTDPNHSPSRMVNWLLDRGADIRFDRVHAGYPLTLLVIWRYFKGPKCLLNDEQFTIIKLFLENGAAKNKVPNWLCGQGVCSWKFFPLDNPFTLEQQAVGIERWSVIIDLLLKDDNFDGKLSDHVDDLLMTLLEHIMHTTFGWVSEPPDPCPPELFTKFYDISHPLMIQKLLSKGASINETSLALPDEKQQRSLVSMLANLGGAPTFIQEGLSSKSKDLDHGVYELWKCALQGEVADEERLLWNPTAGALVDIPDRLDPQEREELRRQRKDAEELFDQQAVQKSAEQRPRGLESFITGNIW
ncbi:uncharacterized protein NECHADRAFT_83306 [Fusarium vanettenii 77-13-4]|uniref:F-box domain-containing protein n=1 Tax=Fusarium vanettenii (strain ATCC MYA-4622 / CBS 123669 / FGSC 9596 / NRRL 45880 / 77-13-4) TaxID=660122 RepID=C7Z3M9_FUSV7|nr:uncharacterized protein NECHADRAFT_83306 [Fusarium vanettenii 77-13-4]EEU41338.1 hypothetical protein NECHADRAFT_83306 [Fusarium vanettenii 77-13-4]